MNSSQFAGRWAGTENGKNISYNMRLLSSHVMFLSTKYQVGEKIRVEK